MSERRQKAVRVAGEIVDRFFSVPPKNDCRFLGITSDAPDDLHVLGVLARTFDPDVWTFLCESDEFDPVPEGSLVPEFTPTYHTHYAPAEGAPA